jgi:hypothetical protein
MDEQGRSAGVRTIANRPEGWAVGLAWAGAAAGPHIWGVEHSGSLGTACAQFLLTLGELGICEDSPHRTAQDRRSETTTGVGRSD